MNNFQICSIDIQGGIESNKFAKKLNFKNSLSNIRETLGNKVSNNIFFTLSDGAIINKEDEENILLEDIIDGKILHMKYIEKKKENKVDLYVNGNYGNYKFKVDRVKFVKLNDIREIINDIITEEGLFLTKDGEEISKEDESQYILEEIIDGNKVNIRVHEELERNKTKTPKEPNQKNEDQKKANTKKENQNKEKQKNEIQRKEIQIKEIQTKDIQKKENQRKKIFNKPTNETHHNINMPNAPEVSITCSYPLKNSLLIENIGALEIYEYPKIIFNEKELKESVKIMVLGANWFRKNNVIKFLYKLFNGHKIY